MQTGAGTVGPRRLLKRIRDMMAASGSGQERLDRIVKIIAADMVAEVCSAYIMRPGEVLELFATEGLKQEAVHQTRLRVGEGIVGDIAAHARALALADAQSHPNFAYRPETGEEIFHSLMGVPLLRGGRVLGVLVVQNRTFRDYSEEEIETLQTIAMVLAELVSSGDLVSLDEIQRVEGTALLPARLEGLKLNQGLAIGRVVMHQPRVTVRQMVAENPDAELTRLQEALSGMHSALDDMLAASDLGEGETREILETYRMFAEDRGWLGRISEAIKSGLTAEGAVQKVQEDTRARMSQISDPYLRERLSDLDDLANRLLRHLIGDRTAARNADLPDDTVVVAHAMGPAELLDYDRRKLKAVVLEEGSPTSHVSIIARALDIPMVGRVRELLSQVEPLDTVVVDGDNGQIVLRPGEDVREMFAGTMRMRAERMVRLALLRDLPAVTRDGVQISLSLNAGLLIDLAHLEDTGADGVGLYRTEIPFMIRSAFPDVGEQIDIYRRVLDRAAGRPIIFRTLDIGGDKDLPYLPNGDDENPAMGWRAIRVALDRPLMLRQQLRAMLRAAAGRELSIMFPMVAEVSEFDAARALFELELARERRRGHAVPLRTRVGTMVEVPALFFQLPALLRRVDFVSVGSNDLMQFLYASDRGNPRLADRYDPLSPGALAFLAGLAQACTRADVPITLCGEMGGRPLEAMALVGLGYRSLSMPPAAIGPVKAMVRSVEIDELERYLRELIRSSRHSIRENLLSFARDHGITV
ncbi:MAG TPA: phosphoenolpyruvate--protein phosphotransferase [Alphaproteobacteria bacterium]|nr:phosphoenolpyruvate--protein phosphotransferase [Alphaproteobacteria bacterium]